MPTYLQNSINSASTVDLLKSNESRGVKNGSELRLTGSDMHAGLESPASTSQEGFQFFGSRIREAVRILTGDPIES